jgi:hypothetical protein
VCSRFGIKNEIIDELIQQKVSECIANGALLQQTATSITTLNQ